MEKKYTDNHNKMESNSNFGLIMVDRHGQIQMINSFAANILNCDEATALGENVVKIFPESKLPMVLEQEKPLRGAKYCNWNNSAGKLEIMYYYGFPIVNNGTMTGAAELFFDESYSQTLLHFGPLMFRNEDLQVILNAIDDGIVLVDAQGVVVSINESYKKMAGIVSYEYIGKNVQELLDTRYINCCLSPIVIERRNKVTIIDRRNGKDLLLTGIPLFNEDDEIFLVVTVVRDVTELNAINTSIKKNIVSNPKLVSFDENEMPASFRRITTKNQVMNKKIALAYRVAMVDSSVLILGESGVGKDLFAHLIHRSSKRSLHPFIKIDCGAIPRNLLESELFGYESGAFTGASRTGKTGLLELAHKGTVFLDEIGELPLDMQTKILRVLQDKEVQRVGGQNSIRLDVRIVAATNKDLEEMVKNGQFREDLYYRLNVVPIWLPPLRERKEDIPALVDVFLENLNQKYSFRKWLHPETMRALLLYDWPGNVRELENVVERLAITSTDNCIGVEVLKDYFYPKSQNGLIGYTTLKSALEEKEKEIISATYEREKSTRRAAVALGISQSCLVKKMRKYQISPIRENIQ